MANRRPTLRYVRRFDELGIGDVPLVGGKNASLGEMYRRLGSRGVRVPNGFATTADGYRRFLEANDLAGPIETRLRDLDIRDVDRLAQAGAAIRALILEAELPDDLLDEIAAAYEELGAQCRGDADVAVRSSATAEDLPDASFAGQQETYLHIRGVRPLLQTCLRVYASLFTDRAIAYRTHHGFAHMQVALSIGVQRMVRSDLGASGVMFTLDTESGFRDAVLITAAWGLGEYVVQGTVNPDEFYVFKPTLDGGHRPIVRRHLGSKARKLVYVEVDADGPGVAPTADLEVSEADRRRFAIDDDDVLELARYAVAIEEHYSGEAGRPMPMDIEWAKDGVSGELFIIQARPETVHANASVEELEAYRLERRGEVLARGKSVGHRIGAGRARVILQPRQMHDLVAGEVLVTDITDPDWEPVMKLASAIVTNRGGRTCHAAIVARELGIPAVVGTGDGTAVIATGADVTVSCAEGDSGLVYAGLLPFRTEMHSLSVERRPRTHVMMNVGDPDHAFRLSRIPNDGVGLARLEFIISNSIRAHPAALLDYAGLDAGTRAQVDALTAGYASPREFYIERLAEGIGTIACAFHPKPVIVRLSDFKSNEYAALIGGARHEPREENPMLGFRGASRYPSPAFAECFALECEALGRVRGRMGLANVVVMVPFVRTPEEGRRVLDLMAGHGLARGRDGLQVYFMCEIPSNCLRADDFLDLCDGYSIGSNDLTQLALGVDRDSALVTGIDERDPTVLALMEMAIAACRRRGKYIGICGQAPSDWPEITRWLVERGIGSISLNPDSVVGMTELVLATEGRGE